MVKLSALFTIKRGTNKGVEQCNAGPIPLVSATTYNQGVVGFISKQPAEAFFSDLPCLTVAINGGGSILFAAIQASAFHATSDTEVLIPKVGHAFWGHKKLEKLIAIATIIRKSRWRFNFGRKAGGRLADVEIEEQEAEALAAMLTPPPAAPQQLAAEDVKRVLDRIRSRFPSGVTVGELFDILKAARIEAADAASIGSVPLASATEKETNAISGFLASAPRAALVPAGTLSVAKNARPLVSRVQMGAYCMTGDVAALRPIDVDGCGWSPQELCILAALIERQAWRFSYGRKASEGRLGELVLF